MAQHDMNIANADGASARADINNALLALVSNNNGTTEPATKFPTMWWPDTTSGYWKQRNAANTAWLNKFKLSEGELALLNGARGSVAMHATTMDLWAQPGIIDGTGSAATVTAIVNAPNAGAVRTLYPIAGSVITDGATFDVDGGANHTAKTGDAWVFEAVTVSTYKVHIINADGTAVVGAGDHEVVVHTGNGFGSTNTRIRRYTTTQSSVGTAITYADSAADGASFTINTPGLYYISYSDHHSTTAAYHGISVNSTQLTTDITGITAADRVAVTSTVAGGNATASCVIKLAAGDVVRPHRDATAQDTSAAFANVFRIRRVSRV